ncbi:helix-turn-helix transcriptional regulator [Kribbia dieselivorans]|uniref:helix-turn-helix transcriptional regulator n=1 Tax=Kribbia dieselivorans TaxID=331526 RepID=UPI0009F9B436|nr:helix-turn-helix domain-containing protein [Kribbia dieselivorans]
MGLVFIQDRTEVTDPTDPSATTRARVLAVVTERGPVSAVSVAQELGITPTAVRRHLDLLLEAGTIEVHQAPAGTRGRGRPAKSFVVAEAGHTALRGEYDELATDAIRYLADTLGPAAIEAFASDRVAKIEQRYRAELDAAGDTPKVRAEALVAALRRDGYAASARPTGTGSDPDSGLGLQLCQGHCPVQHVATEFPQFCDAETEAFGRLLGVHVQRLATLAHGDHVCTTFIPAAALGRTPLDTRHPTDTPTERSPR